MSQLWANQKSKGHKMKSIYARNFERLNQIIPFLCGYTAGDAFKLKAGGYMDLCFDVLESWNDGTQGNMRIALAHYFEQNGDLCCDPDMEIRIAWKGENGIAEALTFQMALPPIYQMVYPEPGKMIPRLKKDLNTFLSDWLKNIIAQGHKQEKETPAN